MKIATEKSDNIFTTMLEHLNVKYTHGYANKIYNEHPYKNNMFGLSMMLSDYKIENMGIRVEKKGNISQLPTPFIAHIGNDFVTVTTISKQNISYYWHRQKLTISIKDFLDIWSGIALIAEANAQSLEPDYKQHKKEEYVTSIQKNLLILAIMVLVGISLYQGQILLNWSSTLLFILNLLGTYIGYLLVQKQINIHSNIADKICSLFAKSNCNDILNSPSAKFLGVIGWSELGLSYFLSNTFILLFMPNLLGYLVLFNILTLPYSFWSIWYQKFKAKTWCPLCLIVQLLFWLMFATNVAFHLIKIPDFTILNILSIALIYGTPFLLINLSLPYQTVSKKLVQITQQFNSLKTNDIVFLGLLKEQAYYNVDEDIPTIIFGDPNAKNTITIFSNPHCEPCGNMHKKIKKILGDTNNKYRVQYILSSFDKRLDSSCEFFLYVNKKYPTKERDKIYDEWFDTGKYDKDNFFKKYSYVIENDIAKDEFQKHLEWREKNKLQATPTVLFNGYELPRMFFQQIDKLTYFTDIKVKTNKYC